MNTALPSVINTFTSINLISLTKPYITQNRLPVRLKFIVESFTYDDGFIVEGEILLKEDKWISCTWTSTGVAKSLSSDFNLVSLDLPVDTPVIVWDDNTSIETPAHFSHIVSNNKFAVFAHGRTSHTKCKLNTTVTYDNCVPV